MPFVHGLCASCATGNHEIPPGKEGPHRSTAHVDALISQVAALTAERDRLRDEVEHYRESYHVATAENAALRAACDPEEVVFLRSEVARLKVEYEVLHERIVGLLTERDGLRAEVKERTLSWIDAAKWVTALRLDLARVTEERELAKADALILAHAYTHDSRPPQSIVDRALTYRGEALRAALAAGEEG